MEYTCAASVEDSLRELGVRIWDTWQEVPDNVPYTQFADAVIRAETTGSTYGDHWINSGFVRFTKVEGKPRFESIYSDLHMESKAPFVEVK